MEKNTPTRGIRNNNPLNIRRGKSKWRGERPDTPQEAPNPNPFPQLGQGGESPLPLALNPQKGEGRAAGEGDGGRAADTIRRKETEQKTNRATRAMPCCATQGAVAGSASSARNAQTGIGAEKADLLSPYEQSSMGAPSGYDPEFCRFIGMEWGFRAAFVLMRTYITKHGCNTIERIVSRWAPAGDGGNQTERYIRDVCRMTGIGGRAPLAESDPRQKEIVWAMAQIESGKGIKDYREAMDRGWEMAEDTPKPPQRGGCREEGEKAGYYPAQ